MHFRHISAKIQLKYLKQHFDWRGPHPPWLRSCFTEMRLLAWWKEFTVRHFTILYC